MRKLKGKRDNGSTAPGTASQAPTTVAWPGAIPWTLIAGGIAFGLALWFYLTRGQTPDTIPGIPRAKGPPAVEPAPEKKAPEKAPPAKDANGEPDATEPENPFLKEFLKGGQEAEASSALRANEDLEKAFHHLLGISERFNAAEARVRLLKDQIPAKELQEIAEVMKRLHGEFDGGVKSFELELKKAREERPNDAVPAWLTAELLILINGEPDVILKHLRRAVAGGLVRPRLFVALARGCTEANLLEEGFRWADKGLNLAGQDRHAWTHFTRAAFNTERFAEVARRLDRAFPDKMPDWAAAMRSEAIAWEGHWQAEQKLRAAEAKAGDLPRVRLVIEHRRFVQKDRGTLPKIEATGRGEVVLELFENQAPETVANFLHLVSQKFYDGTRFHSAEPAMFVVGGDPRSKAADPARDGTGGPGYVIPDEFARPDARRHFRGALGMVNNGPQTAGSQFYLTFVPARVLDGGWTVFGRVLKGQDVVDRMTLGRTTTEAGRFGLIIPGDLIVSAEVLRKRAHEYKVTRIQPK